MAPWIGDIRNTNYHLPLILYQFVSTTEVQCKTAEYMKHRTGQGSVFKDESTFVPSAFPVSLDHMQK